MNYDTYYQICKETYAGTINDFSSVEKFYEDPVRVFPENMLGSEYTQAVDSLSIGVKADFDSFVDCNDDGIMVKHTNMWKYREQICQLSDIITPYLEENRFGCHLYVDKIYIYRTLAIKERKSSYEWHYDNNPHEIVKNLIYLTDVTEDNSPYEYLATSDSIGTLGYCTRRGTEMWYPAPNNSRVGHLLNEFKAHGYSPKTVVGNKGTMISFMNNAIHRVNPIRSGYRDVINIRVKPTAAPAPEYANEGWTTGFEVPGVVNKNPELAWKVKY